MITLTVITISSAHCTKDLWGLYGFIKITQINWKLAGYVTTVPIEPLGTWDSWSTKRFSTPGFWSQFMSNPRIIMQYKYLNKPCNLNFAPTLTSMQFWVWVLEAPKLLWTCQKLRLWRQSEFRAGSPSDRVASSRKHEPKPGKKWNKIKYLVGQIIN